MEERVRDNKSATEMQQLVMRGFREIIDLLLGQAKDEQYTAGLKEEDTKMALVTLSACDKIHSTLADILSEYEDMSRAPKTVVRMATSLLDLLTSMLQPETAVRLSIMKEIEKMALSPNMPRMYKRGH